MCNTMPARRHTAQATALLKGPGDARRRALRGMTKGPVQLGWATPGPALRLIQICRASTNV